MIRRQTSFQKRGEGTQVWAFARTAPGTGNQVAAGFVSGVSTARFRAVAVLGSAVAFGAVAVARAVVAFRAVSTVAVTAPTPAARAITVVICH